MINRCKNILAVSLAGILLVGCGSDPEPAAPQAVEQRQSTRVFTRYIPATQPTPENTQDLPTHPLDAQPAMSLMYSVQIWQIMLPRGAVSGNEAFWKRVDEQTADLGENDIRLKNGIRIGQLPATDLSVITDLIEERHGTKTSVEGLAGRLVEIPVNKKVPEQTLFYFDRSNLLKGRTYQDCENLFFFSFESTPRKTNQIRLALTPAVRGVFKKLQYSTLAGRDEREVSYNVEESRYDANITMDLPLRSVLVVGPSLGARDSMSLGSTYLVQRTPTEELERLIVIIPQAFRKQIEESADGR